MNESIHPPHPPQPKKSNAATCWIVGGVLGCVGIVVLAVLAGFMFPAAKGVMKKAERANAENTVHNLKNAISAFGTEYRKFPVRNPVKNEDTLAQSNHALMDVLLVADHESGRDGLNPRRISFYSGKRAKPAENGKFRKGVKLESGGAGELWDPYSNYYKVLMDTDNNNSIDSPETPGVPIKATIIVWSAGPDGDFDTWDDNVKTW